MHKSFCIELEGALKISVRHTALFLQRVHCTFSVEGILQISIEGEGVFLLKLHWSFFLGCTKVVILKL